MTIWNDKQVLLIFFVNPIPKTIDSNNAILIRDEATEREAVLYEPSWGD